MSTSYLQEVKNKGNLEAIRSKGGRESLRIGGR